MNPLALKRCSTGTPYTFTTEPIVTICAKPGLSAETSTTTR